MKYEMRARCRRLCRWAIEQENAKGTPKTDAKRILDYLGDYEPIKLTKPQGRALVFLETTANGMTVGWMVNGNTVKALRRRGLVRWDDVSGLGMSPRGREALAVWREEQAELEAERKKRLIKSLEERDARNK